jgi:16S rRNA (adenine1518-N6/adenine1519-N6)-dimethyltransferase
VVVDQVRRGTRGGATDPAYVTSLLGPAEVRELAATLGVRPTKTLGQNFVHDPNTIRRIVRLADLHPDDVVIEVGPGLGSLTLGLLPSASVLHAVEIDRVLAQALASTVARHAPELVERLRVHHRDALQVHADELVPAPDILVANLPYNTAVPILLHLFAELRLSRAVVMVQREVAERLTAGPGSKVYGVPSVKLHWFGRAELAGRVPASVFWPVPNVESALVRVDARPRERGGPDGADLSRAEVFAVVDAAFAQRRKMLRSALATWAGGAATVDAVLASAGIAPTSRAEELPPDAFTGIARAGREAGVPGMVGGVREAGTP